MRRFLVTLVGLVVLGFGGLYFALETYYLPRQEQIWRDLLADLPPGYQADFGEVDFGLFGLTLSVSDLDFKAADGSVVHVKEVIAENSPQTALKNFLNILQEKEEEAYDLIRFNEVTPSNAGLGVDVKVLEVRLHNVRLGIDENLEGKLGVQTLTGAIGLDKAIASGDADGIEIYGASVTAEGLNVHLGAFRLLEVADETVGLISIEDFKVSMMPGMNMRLDMAKAVDLNLSPILVPANAFMASLQGRPVPNQKVSDPLHAVRSFEVEGYSLSIANTFKTSLDRLYYYEESLVSDPRAGLVPTETRSGLVKYYFDFAGLAQMSPDFQMFQQATEITDITVNAASSSHWGLAEGTYSTEGNLDLENLLAWSVDLGLDNFTLDLLMDTVEDREVLLSSAFSNSEGLGAMGLLQSVIEVAGQQDSGWSDVLLGHFHMKIENESLIERLIRYGAAMAGTSEADFTAMIDAQLVAAKQSPELQGELDDDIDALRAFVANPGMLTVNMDPPEPVSLGTLDQEQDMAALVRMLGLVIRANGVE